MLEALIGSRQYGFIFAHLSFCSPFSPKIGLNLCFEMTCCYRFVMNAIGKLFLRQIITYSRMLRGLLNLLKEWGRSYVATIVLGFLSGRIFCELLLDVGPKYFPIQRNVKERVKSNVLQQWLVLWFA